MLREKGRAMRNFDIDGQSEHDFREAIQTMLRHGEGEKALARLAALLAPYCTNAGPFPARCPSMSARDVEVLGWRAAIERIADLERKGCAPITALSIDISWPGHRDSRPDAQGRLDPDIETNFYTDSAWPFSTSDFAGLLKGYSSHHSKWQGAFEDLDEVVEVKGLGELYGAIWRLKNEDSQWPDKERAAALGAMFVQVLLHLAVRASAPLSAFRHPTAIIVGSNEEYPFFDAPVFAASSRARALFRKLTKAVRNFLTMRR